jgi:hypothetical protein
MNLKIILVAVVCALAPASSVSAQGAAFTFQGRLDQQSTPATGVYDLTFSLYSAESGGNPLTLSNQFNALGVTNGTFTVTLDFGPQFNGFDRWLEVAVRTNGANTFTALSPRKKILATPYAQYAPEAGIARTAMGASADAVSGNALQTSSVTTEKIADGTITTNDLSPALANSFWKLGGNGGTTPDQHFLGTTDNQPLDFRVNNQRVLRIAFHPDFPSTPNIIAGSASNIVGPDAVGATIGGGGGPGSANRNYGSLSVIGGGSFNVVSNSTVTIAGGSRNVVNGRAATIGGGEYHRIDSYAGTIGGGHNNFVSETGGTVGGGQNNTASGFYGAVPGGDGNQRAASTRLPPGTAP